MEILELNGANCRSYALVSRGRAALVDPLRERAESYRRDLERNGWTLDLVIETHTHADHMMLDREQRESLAAPLIMHRESPNPLVGDHVSDGETLELGGETIEVIHTPGHTPDSMSLLVPGAVITGDSLWIGGTGRTDFTGGDAGTQFDAITGRLFALPDATVVWPGHDYRGNRSSTIGVERRSNPRLAGRSRAEYILLMSQLGLGLPDRMQEVLQVNQSGFENSEVAFPVLEDVAKVATVSASNVAKRLSSKEPPLLLDVREPEEFVGELGHIQGAILVPLDSLEKRLPKLVGYAGREIVVVCRAGARSATAVAMLSSAGFARAANLEGGMLAWARASLPVQR